MWATREEGRAGTVEAELQEGLAAYAREQRWREIETCDTLKQKWAGVRAKGHAYLAKETAPGVDIVVVDLDDEDYREGEGDDEEEEGMPDYEDEGDDEVIE
jgi:hypothetical protein